MELITTDIYSRYWNLVALRILLLVSLPSQQYIWITVVIRHMCCYKPQFEMSLTCALVMTFVYNCHQIDTGKSSLKAE